ncbi:MAG TPA: alanine--tRNA ligase, partial [Bacteroidetes bacterium]|nr:alanine--tRNA ligase [Bacteroidota bacterium]
GVGQRPYKRAADVQKCIRVSGKHNDLEEVGRDTYHHTFFEMLGNWSFGDYYKREAIQWAWELLTEEWGLPKDALWATVFEEDDEAAELWPEVTDLPAERVLRFGHKDNFWEMGATGPCGPCTEIHIDRGPEFCDKKDDPNHVCQVNGGCARFIELWNLVFIQYNRDENGELHELPAKHVDTGAGLERLVAVLQGKASNYDTDLFQPIIRRIEEITGKSYEGGFTEPDVAFRVLADHIRALSFAIADGALPSNEGRGYVLRRILRRAARFGRILDVHEPFIFRLVQPVADVMGDFYPEVRERQDLIERVIKTEEESFGRTLDRGLEIFEQKAAALLAAGEKVFPGDVAFLLHDTYGFPLDLTQLMARERGLTVDEEGFNRLMNEQRERSQKASTFEAAAAEVAAEIGADIPPTRFVGYTKDETEAKVLAVLGDKVILDETPFYAESGGQVGDTGVLIADGREYRVVDTQKSGDRYLHFVEGATEEELAGLVGKTVLARIDVEKRRATERNHTATHLLHKALRTILGEHAQQSGSLVHPQYLRFDFNHFEKVKPEELEAIERMVNEAIVANYPVNWEIVPFDEAKRRGAVALFGEKYGDQVRIVEVDDYSRELCGGTHVRATGEIGYFHIVSESAVAAGVR